MGAPRSSPTPRSRTRSGRRTTPSAAIRSVVIADYLNDAEEIDKAGRKGGPAITSAQGNVGVVVKPPFPSDCEQEVRKGLNKLDPKKKEQ